MSNRILGYSAVVLALVAGSVSAHTAFIAPVSFTPANDNWVSLDAGLTEELFKSDIAFENSQFQVLSPAGKWQAPNRVEVLHSRTVIEHQLNEAGTYRISTGVRQGAVVRAYELNGERKTLRDPKLPLPAGAKLLETSQSLTRAETYLSRDTPNSTALQPYQQGVELVVLTEPNGWVAGSSLKFKALGDGKPLADKTIKISSPALGTKAKPLTATSNAQGIVELKLTEPGVYLLNLRHSLPAPKGAEVQSFSHTYNLTLDVKAPL